MFYSLIFSLFLDLAHSADIIIDPGHGGTNFGALSVDGKTLEKDLTLDFSKELRSKLEKKGLRAVLTRNDDRFLSLFQRGEIADSYRARCFISVHFNASPLHNRTGIEIYHPTEDNGPEINLITGFVRDGESFLKRKKSSDQLIVASYIQEKRKNGFYLKSREFGRKLAWKIIAHGFHVDRIVPGNFDVLFSRNSRAILFEGGFIDHPVEGRKILKKSYREKLADSLVHGLLVLCR
ncbi:MAG: N-acetylmuramoyl-L-alanine amidase [Deltaproteobacteria bacterium]|nr:N-acetylmuramoyl-L-alanine amidase [Deltaproteobacteria bacterium]